PPPATQQDRVSLPRLHTPHRSCLNSEATSRILPFVRTHPPACARLFYHAGFGLDVLPSPAINQMLGSFLRLARFTRADRKPRRVAHDQTRFSSLHVAT